MIVYTRCDDYSFSPKAKAVQPTAYDDDDDDDERCSDVIFQ